jgi:hypothetical protein
LSRRELLKRGISFLKQRQRGKYPRLRDALYGKRNEYWEQAKLLLQGVQSDEVESLGGLNATEEAPVVSSEEVDATETPQEPSPDKKQEESVLDAQSESFEAEGSISAELIELKERGLLERVLETLRQSAYDRLTKAEDRADDKKIKAIMDFFDKQRSALFSEEKEGADARAFIFEIIGTYLSETELTLEEKEPYEKVLNALSPEESVSSLDEAA